jgi:hypothetical protein
MLHCHIALICYIAFVQLHCFDMLHCHIALICYIATLLWYATLSHCFDILHWNIALTLLLFFYIVIYMNAYYIAQWWKWSKWDEFGNVNQHYCTIKISASNNMKQIGYSIKLKSESIQMKFFFFFFAIILCEGPFLTTEATTQHFISPKSAFLTKFRTTN